MHFRVENRNGKLLAAVVQGRRSMHILSQVYSSTVAVATALLACSCPAAIPEHDLLPLCSATAVVAECCRLTLQPMPEMQQRDTRITHSGIQSYCGRLGHHFVLIPLVMVVTCMLAPTSSMCPNHLLAHPLVQGAQI